MKYVKREDGDGWPVRNRETFRVGCCDCGLVHDFMIDVPDRRKGATIAISARRNNRATAQKRRHKRDKGA